MRDRAKELEDAVRSGTVRAGSDVAPPSLPNKCERCQKPCEGKFCCSDCAEGENLADPEVLEMLSVDGAFEAEANLIRCARARSGLSQRKFADLIGTSNVTVARWESGEQKIPGPVKALALLFVALRREAVRTIRDLGEAFDARPERVRRDPMLPALRLVGTTPSERAQERPARERLDERHEKIRAQVFERDRGVCSNPECKLDCVAFREELDAFRKAATAGQWGARLRGLKQVGFDKHRVESGSDLWDFDHVNPRVKGGPTTLENARTLCVACHKVVTKKLAQGRKEARRPRGRFGRG